LLVGFTLVKWLGCTGEVTGTAESQKKAIESFNWRNFEGQEIRFVTLNFYYSNLLSEYVKEFTDKTGITVKIESFPESQHYQKVMVELAAGNTSMDVFATAGNCNEGFSYSLNGWYEPLDKYISSPALTSPDWDPADFFESVYDAQIIDGKRIAIPMNAVTWVMYYRKDLFAAKGIAVPKTMEELFAAAKALNSPEVYGYVGRGSRAQSAMTWSNFLYNFGGSWMGADGKPAFNSPKGVKALELYGDLLKNYSNPGASSTEWPDVQAMMQQGQAAMIIDANAWLGAFTDPTKSKIVGKLGIAPVPTAVGEDPASVLWAWNLAISPFSKNKEAAWLFIQWATSKEIQKRIQDKNFVTSRKSAWASETYLANVNKDWLAATLVSLEHATPMLYAQAVPSAEINDIVGAAIVNVVQGVATPKSALDAAAEQIKLLIK
jgi:multiple sugar transport system substrate-binding protein